MGFIKLLKSLKTKTPKGKTASRKSKKELVDEIREKENNKGEKIMPNDKEEVKTEEKVEKSTPTEETTKTTETDKKEEVETKPSEDANGNNGDNNNPVDNGTEQGDNDTIQEIQEPETPNAIPVEDLVTKEDLKQALEAFNAKIDALIKENKDLTDKLTNAEKENSGLKEKYEDKDFGNMAKQGSIVKDTDANDTFDEYAKKFL